MIDSLRRPSWAQVRAPCATLYREYYDLHEAWIASGYVKGAEVDGVLCKSEDGDDPKRRRPSLIPAEHMGVGPPATTVVVGGMQNGGPRRKSARLKAASLLG